MGYVTLTVTALCGLIRGVLTPHLWEGVLVYYRALGHSVRAHHVALRPGTLNPYRRGRVDLMTPSLDTDHVYLASLPGTCLLHQIFG